MPIKEIVASNPQELTPTEAYQFFKYIKAQFESGDNLEKPENESIQAVYKSKTGASLTYRIKEGQGTLRIEGRDTHISFIERKLREGGYI